MITNHVYEIKIKMCIKNNQYTHGKVKKVGLAYLQCSYALKEA